MTDIWDVELSGNETNEYPVLPEGKYNFTVKNAVAKEYLPNENSKIERCAEIDLTLEVVSGGTKYTVFDKLFFAEKTVWKVTSYTKCIGIFFKGMKPKDVYTMSIGEKGEAVIGIKTYNGKKSNTVKEYIEAPSNPLEIDNGDLPF